MPILLIFKVFMVLAIPSTFGEFKSIDSAAPALQWLKYLVLSPSGKAESSREMFAEESYAK